MVGIPAPAIVGRSVGPATVLPDVLVAEAEEEESVVEASVDVAVVSLEVVDDLAEEVVLVDSSVVPPLSSGRSLSCAFMIGAPASASSASSCVFLARRTMFAVVMAFSERRLTTTMRLCRCYGWFEVFAGRSVCLRLSFGPAFPCLPVSDDCLLVCDDGSDAPGFKVVPRARRVAAGCRRIIAYACAGRVQEDRVVTRAGDCWTLCFVRLLVRASPKRCPSNQNSPALPRPAA